MLGFILQRLVQAIPVVVLSSIGIFLLMRMLPGDPAQILAGAEGTPENIAAIRQEMGLDQPLPVQYLIWAQHALQGDLGKSALNRLPVSQLIMQRLPATMELAIAGVVLTVIIAIPLGVIAAVKQRTPIDWAISAFCSVTIALPSFWLGILLIILFAVVLGWLPPGNRGDFSRDPLTALKFLALPAFSLALPNAVSLARWTKASVLEVLYEDYVRTARAKGLADKMVLTGHVLRNALVPIVTAIGLEFGRLLGGAIVVESVYAWPGVGTLILSAITSRDYLVVQAALLMLVLIFIVINLLTDILYGFIDPRIRLSTEGRG